MNRCGQEAWTTEGGHLEDLDPALPHLFGDLKNVGVALGLALSLGYRPSGTSL